jgi:hydroxyacylglutathione hydrolase
MDLLAIPAFTDNYIWVLHDGGHALVVDPGQATPISELLQARNWQLELILLTHHHADHTGGVADLCLNRTVPVYGPARESLPAATRPLREGDSLQWRQLRLDVLETPGHTAGHLSYVARHDDGRQWLFCGDTLFSAGCGRLFEGSPAQMRTSLDKYAGLPDATWVCAAHEYTLANLAFALAVEPDNADLIQYQAQCQQLRARHRPTLPSTLGLERRINPFLRSREPRVVTAVQLQQACAGDDAAVFGALRQWKNDFK